MKISTDNWDKCPAPGCSNGVCYALRSDKCFYHTKGSKGWKRLKMWINALITP